MLFVIKRHDCIHSEIFEEENQINTLDNKKKIKDVLYNKHIEECIDDDKAIDH